MIYKQKKCKYCNTIFRNIEGHTFSNHMRWCDKNPKEKYTSDGMQSLKDKVNKRYGKLIDVEKNCALCGKPFTVKRRSKMEATKKEKKCCSRACAAKYSATFFDRKKYWNNENKNKASKDSKQLWANEEYVQKQLLNNGNTFTSKGEREIREYFKESFPNDGWTSGGPVKQDGVNLVRDLYSKKLKVCIEYDGIWHFKDIKGQLTDKQKKDALLKKWCHLNGYKLIRIREEIYHSDRELWKKKLIENAYNSDATYVEFY